jgi:hypothetical protein
MEKEKSISQTSAKCLVGLPGGLFTEKAFRLRIVFRVKQH